MAADAPQSYPRAQAALHWLVAALVAGQYATSGAITRSHATHLIGQRPDPGDLFLHAWHNRAGLAVVALTLARLALRLWAGAPAPLGPPASAAARLARFVHAAFYAVLIFEGAAGAVASYVWWPASVAHVLAFKALLALLAVHVAAALWHLGGSWRGMDFAKRRRVGI